MQERKKESAGAKRNQLFQKSHIKKWKTTGMANNIMTPTIALYLSASSESIPISLSNLVFLSLPDLSMHRIDDHQHISMQRSEKKKVLLQLPLISY